ncbi:hypothetical protein CBS63078_7844 [Aspergillus niger]|nr:hypothetical protein CBS115989_9000 [Aspergillus niger]KAI2824423.1 hypothetical protein CBS133816_8907 [Aspergillus niger]KAI2838480.1 hypothetical protein CBS11350_8103 [Aspergillus niger]KAI2845189.1 hypothetical protein CBS11232_7782 [Aspergillus niger]KAI2849771.1 hypothetical protein CBS12448_8857 [Aspergillus niger]
MENEKGEIVDLIYDMEETELKKYTEKGQEKERGGIPNTDRIAYLYHHHHPTSQYMRNRQKDKPRQNANIKFNSYVPRKCSATNRIIKANDHASVQISIAKVDENGRYTGENHTYALCGFIRARGESDDSLNRLAQRDGYVRNVWTAARQR